MISRRLLPLILLVAVAVTMPIAFASSAHAQIVERLEVEVVGGGPVFDFSEIYPSATLSSVVRVSNVGDEAGHVTVDASDIVDESRCSGAETRANIPCGSGRGHLGDQVQFSIEHLPASGDPATVWSGHIEELEDVAITVAPLAAGTSSEYQFSAHLPGTSGNETQSDLLGFDLRFRLAGEPLVGEAAEVLGASVKRDHGARLLGITLPRTGSELAHWGLVGGGALLMGSVLTLVSSARARFLR